MGYTTNITSWDLVVFFGLHAAAALTIYGAYALSYRRGAIAMMYMTIGLVLLTLTFFAAFQAAPSVS